MSIGVVCAGLFFLAKNDAKPAKTVAAGPQLGSSLPPQESPRDPQSVGPAHSEEQTTAFKPKIVGPEAVRLSRQLAMAKRAAHAQERAIPNQQLFEVPELAAHRKAKGYDFFSYKGESPLTNFNGTDLPVVRSPNSNTLGVATGDIVVTFKKFPENSEHFAGNFELKTVKEFPRINVVFFRPRQLPANLTSHLEELRTNPDVEKAELSVVFGERRAQ